MPEKKWPKTERFGDSLRPCAETEMEDICSISILHTKDRWRRLSAVVKCKLPILQEWPGEERGRWPDPSIWDGWLVTEAGMPGWKGGMEIDLAFSEGRGLRRIFSGQERMRSNPSLSIHRWAFTTKNLCSFVIPHVFVKHKMYFMRALSLPKIFFATYNSFCYVPMCARSHDRMLASSCVPLSPLPHEKGLFLLSHFLCAA